MIYSFDLLLREAKIEEGKEDERMSGTKTSVGSRIKKIVFSLSLSSQLPLLILRLVQSFTLILHSSLQSSIKQTERAR